MTKTRSVALSFAILVSAPTAFAEVYTFQSSDNSGNKSDMMDLEHGYYYGWSIADTKAAALGAALASGKVEIVSAKLEYKNIYNWTYEANDQLNSFLLSAPPPLPGSSEKVAVVINGEPQGHNVYTFQKATTTNVTTINTASLPSGCSNANTTCTLTKTESKYGKTYRTYAKTVTSTKVSTNSTPPGGYSLVSTTFKADEVTLGNGIALSANLWERSDQQSLTDIDWGVDGVYRIQDVNGDPMNPWHDVTGGVKKNWTLTYDFNEGTLNTLYTYLLDGSFGIGIDPDCHYYNDGITLTIETAPTPPVPEPETYGMLMAGLGVIGLIARRRKLNG